MNEVIQNILNRRSIRAYSEEQIKQEELDLIIQAGLYSPSACNGQPWHFTVVKNKDIINTLSVESKKEFVNSENELFRKMATSEQFNLFYHAPCVIVVSGEKCSEFAPVDCAAATENMLLAAESMNIGTCFIGLVAFLFRSKRVDEFAKMLEIPENYEPYHAISLGYKKYPDPKPPKRRENTVNYIN